MFADFVRAFAAAAVTVVLPGYFWAVFLRPASGLATRLTYSMLLSMASVPVIALGLARLAGTGVTLWIALVSVGLVFVSGAMAVRVAGAAAGSAAPVLPRPRPIRDGRVLALLAIAFVLALVAMGGQRVSLFVSAQQPAGALLIVIALALVAAGALAAWRPGRAGGPEPARSLPAELRLPALTVVLGLTAFRAYAGVINHDWPYLRGSDLFSHAVMAEQMLAHGSYNSYLVYPPGLPSLTAVICRVSGLSPLSLFPVLAPALLLVTAMGAYALAEELWGWEFGVLAAGLSGLVLIGAYAGFAAGRYPDLISAYFLVTMTVAALIWFFHSPTGRSGMLLAVTGGAVVLYHSVATLYLVVLLAITAVTALTYLLWRRRRRETLGLLVALAGTGVLGACYAWITYGLPGFLGGGSATSTAVSIALGSQPAPAGVQILNALAPAIVWLGALGVAMLGVSTRYLRSEAQVLAVVTVLLWCAIMYAGSRTAVDGFPDRFQRDIGAPLSVVGALGLGVILASLPRPRARARTIAGMVSIAAAGLACALVAWQGINDQIASAQRARDVLSRPVAAAGTWLARHNDGSGTIISSPFVNNGGLSNRAVLALSGYTGLQSYSLKRIRQPRSLPPAGRQPLLDSHEVLTHPRSCRAAGILVKDNVRYVFLYKFDHHSDLAGFRADPRLYRNVLDNARVEIYQPTHKTCTG